MSHADKMHAFLTTGLTEATEYVECASCYTGTVAKVYDGVARFICNACAKDNQVRV